MYKKSYNLSSDRFAQHVANHVKGFITIRLQLRVMDYRSYIKRIQAALDKIKATDEIQESPWQEVVVRRLMKYRKVVQRIYRQKLAKLAIKVTIN